MSRKDTLRALLSDRHGELPVGNSNDLDVDIDTPVPAVALASLVRTGAVGAMGRSLGRIAAAAEDARAMISAGDATIYFDDFQIFQNRAVAKSVKILVNGQLNAAIKVTLLEPLAPSDAKVVTPPSNAVAEPYTIEPGLPTPESVFEVGASIPIPPGGFPFRGSVSIPVILQKDGSVKLAQRSPDWTRQDVVDAVKSAVVKWKYKPYLLDGQPIEVGFSILYFVDGKPFVPSYNRPKAAATP